MSLMDWFRGKPTCPIDEDTKWWMESRFSWLTEELGLERLLQGRTVVPTEEFLPRDYDCSEEGIHDLMCRVARYMDVDPDTLNLHFYEDTSPQYEGVANPRTAGLYYASEDKFNILLELQTLNDPASVVATLAHEIGHVILLGQNRISPEEPDHEKLTDLLTVFMGMGIIPANSVVHESHWQEGQSSVWKVGKRGYMSMNMYGYALALYTLARSDPYPNWSRHLRLDVRAAMKQSVRYIQKTQDCEFLPAKNGSRGAT